jgi:hypothetical protein
MTINFEGDPSMDCLLKMKNSVLDKLKKEVR